MADKSLSTIASELWQGFGNNPRNAETFDTLANVFPPAMLYRGAKTLANTDYGAMKDFLLGKYQISQTPKQDLQRTGQAITDLGFGAMDVAPALPLVKPALKAAAPIAARQAVNMAERYGVSPTMNIVKPEGNLNLTTRLDEQIRGPETQTVFDLLKQVQGKPGVTKEGLKVIAQNYPDSAARITKQEFAESIPPSQYSKVDLKQAARGDLEQYLDMAADTLTMEDAVRQAGIPDQFRNDALMLQYGDIEFNQLDPQSQRILGRIYGIDDTMNPNDIMNTVEDANYGFFHDVVRDTAEMLAEGEVIEAGYPYEGIQRLVQSQAPHDYFEFGVTHPSQTGEYKHYRSGEAPEGLVGHVRGSYAATEPLELKGGITTKPNSYVIEEIQSDAQKGVEQTGPLHQVHGTLLKSAVQDAAERGADYVYVPTSYPISDTRGLSIPEDYAAIYDKAVMKEGLDPLRKIPGIEINTLEGRHLKRNLDIVDAPYYHEIKLTPEAREYILEGPGQQVPGYAAGGMVASDYDEERIDRLSDEIFNFAEGGIVDKIARAGRKGQYKIAELVGLRPEVEFATEIPERYYPANEQHNARGDAMRHMLLQAQLMQKYGETPAKVIGWLHENLSGPQGDAEQAMDEYNDRLGREIGRVATDKADMAYRAMQAIEKRKAKTLTEREMNEGYAEGGLVYNDEEINNLADQLLGA